MNENARGYAVTAFDPPPPPYGTYRDPYPPRSRSQLPGLLIVGVLALTAAWFVTRSDRGRALYAPDSQPRAVTPRGDLAADEKATIEVFREASPAVVYITNIGMRQRPFSLDVFEIPQGAGSGFVWDGEGHVVTNLHVIQNATSVQVTLADHSVWEAAFVGASVDKDVAVLKIDAPAGRLKPLPVGRSGDLVVGQKVFAIGNPFGLDQTLTTGVVSALGREIKSLNSRTIRDVIQTDAAINPGNSGGPLLDSAGRLIGVNTQIASPSGASAGIGFAVPVDIVNRVVPEIIRHGKVIRPGLGIRTVPDSIARQLGVEGVIILDVSEDSAAGRAELRGTVLGADGRLVQLGDAVVRIDDHDVRDLNDLLDVLEQYKVGDQVKVTYTRDGRRRTATVRLQALE